ncbi:MAG TPA: hydrogenase iron-sulfur subunit [Gammaproteobacteria bacterium]|nr:hydrogenase iron-sulfur subunit [Gammaproteobacteria bacterium]
MSDEMKIGAYICKGCGIADRLDVGQLEMTATRDGKAAICKQHDFLCSEEGVKLIQDDIDNEGVNRVVIAACSRRAKTEAFQFENVALVRTNLREGVIWVRPDTDEARETTQEMGDDYVRMGCAEAKYAHPPKPSGEQGLTRAILIAGGGVSGMTAALEASKAGYKSTIVEKSGSLGGATAQLFKKIPTKAPYADPEDTGVDEMIAAVEADPNITVFLNATLTKTAGAPGRFEADITTESGSTETQMFGSIVQASGFKPFDASVLTEFSYGKSKDVVTQLELEALAKEANGGPIKRPSDGKEVSSVMFIQCAGQRSKKEGHLEHCSGYCCSASIKQAMYFKDQNPDIDTVVLYTDLRTPGAGGENFYRSGQKKGVIFTKGVASEVVHSQNPTVKFKDLILDEDTEVEVDLVVLATGMVPNAGSSTREELTADENEAKETGNEIRIDADSILNLDYRQGKDVPHMANGFADSHFICFPYETQRTGIYTAGPTRRPMDVQQAIDDATGAAMKAINEAENAALGRAAHPRSGDLSFPSFRKEGCTQCKRCTVECPFGAINEDEEGYPVYNESRCRRCGTCMGACPVRVISFENYSIDTVGQQLKAVDIPDEFDEKPRILVLACENDAYPALDMAAQNKMEYSAFTRIIPVRCLGSVSLSWITDSMNSGFDGVILMGCPSGDDYQCHFVKGSGTAQERMGKVGDTLESLSLEKERVQTYEISITDIQKVTQIINDMESTIEQIGMSPFKF